MKTAGLVGRLFLAFLTIGFLTDISLWYLYGHNSSSLSIYIFNFYSLCEAAFFFWLIQYLTQSFILKSISKRLLQATIPIWLAGFIVFPYFIEQETARSIPFATLYEVIVSFLSGFALLHLTEHQPDIYETPSFWFNLAIFLYCFCTFFIMTLLGSYLSLNLWALNNIINIITYVLYSIGLWKYRKQAKTQTR